MKSLYDVQGGTVLHRLRTVHLLISIRLYIAFYQEFSKVQGSFVKQGFSNLQPGKPFEYVIGAYGRKEKQVIHTSVV